MLPGRFWQKELLEEWKSRKGLFIRFFFPFLILVPLAAAPVPVPVRATGIILGILFIGVFGSAIGLARIRENGMLDRLLVLPLPPSGLLMEYILANAGADCLQLSVPFTIVVLSGSPDTQLAVALPLFFISAVVAANAIGTLIPVFSGSSADVHLASFIVVLALMAVSIPFMPALYAVGQFLPFGTLAAWLAAVWGVATVPWYAVAAAPAATAAIVLAVVLCAGHLKASD